jgi:hypothetical protein
MYAQDDDFQQPASKRKPRIEDSDDDTETYAVEIINA